MKKITLTVMAFVMVLSTALAQKRVTLVDVKGAEVAILIDVDGKSSFKEFYLFQYEKQDLQKVLELKELTLVEVNEDFVKLKSENGQSVIFSLNPDLNNRDNMLVNGYGLSKRTGNFTLTENESPSSIFDLILYNGNVVEGMSCHSGGPGSSECSVTPSDVNVGATSCSVKCNKGYYSCCDDTIGECRCKPEKKTLTVAPN